MMRILRTAFTAFAIGCALVAHAAGPPVVSKSSNGGQLLVNGRPYLILGGEIGNSSAGTMAQADSILPRLARMHFNTVLMPVAWEQVEPKEGAFDFSVQDHWIDVARQQNLHLVFLWFGSWKNAFSNYAPEWIKKDTRRFPRAISDDGTELEILSTLGTESMKSDSRAFAALMKHVRDKDQEQRTVLMVQVENEVGYLGRGRDRSPAANRLFQSPVPAEFLQSLQAHREEFSPELHTHFNPAARTWQEIFGDAADEVFMAWNYARYMQTVAAADRTRTTLRFIVSLRRQSISSPLIFTGPTSSTGSIATGSQEMRSSFPKRASTVHPTMLSTRSEKPRHLVFHHSEWRVCKTVLGAVRNPASLKSMPC